jgi:low affinity Fe/Cu permease
VVKIIEEEIIKAGGLATFSWQLNIAIGITILAAIIFTIIFNHFKNKKR